MNYSVKDFIPLILILSIVVIVALVKSFISGNFDLLNLMTNFMGSFFIIFGTFKIVNLQKFAMAYAEYDLIAKRSRAYALIYPFIELFLGVAYFAQYHLNIINIITFILMSVSAAGVANELSKGKMIICACLGALFKIPMTYVTLLEDLLMALMALVMLFI